MRKVIYHFLSKLQKDTTIIGLLYLSGNGISLGNDLLFFSVDKETKTEEEIYSNAINTNYLFEKLTKTKNSLNIIILDIPRKNPFTNNQQGSSGFVSIPDRTFMIYSTAPGSNIFPNINGQNSNFATELSKAILTEKIEINEVFRMLSVNLRKYKYKVLNQGTEYIEIFQTPWSTSAMKEDFYFIK
jgi:hypothetical protein